MNIIWKSESIATVSQKELATIELLLPYWGLTFEKGSNSIKEALEQCSVYIEGIEINALKLLSVLLSHTGVSITDNKLHADFSLLIFFNQTIEAPIIITSPEESVLLNPMSVDSNSLNHTIHHTIKIPRHSKSVQVTIQPKHKENYLQWVSYIVIQHFLTTKFKDLSHISLKDYDKLISIVLNQINAEFGYIQLRDGSETNRWPELPPQLTSSSKGAYTLMHANQKQVAKSIIKKKSPIDPFKFTKINRSQQAFNPFKFQNNSAPKSIINPFEKKR